MKYLKLISLVFLASLTFSCTTTSEKDDEFVVGEEVKPPIGCVEGRERGVDC